MSDNENKNKPLNAERFVALLEAYGADLARWPASERLAAHAYSVSAPEAPRLLAEAAALDRLLAALPEPRPSAALRAAVLARAGEARQIGFIGKAGALLESLFGALWPRAASWQPASVFAAAMVLGVWLGSTVILQMPAAETTGGGEDVLAYSVPTLVQDVN